MCAPASVHACAAVCLRRSGFKLASAWRLVGQAALVCMLCMACGIPDKLGGSVQDSLALDFDTTVITVQGTDLVVQYLLGGNVTCGLVLHTTAGELQAGSVLTDKTLVAAVSLSRAVRSGGQFPDVVGGTLRLDAYSTTPGQQVAGRFAFELADGHSLTGTFDGPIRSLVNATALGQAPDIAPQGKRVKPSRTSSAANRKAPRQPPRWGRVAAGLKE